MNIPRINESNNKLYIQKHYPEFYNYLIERYKDYSYTKFSELLYCYFHNISEHPICPICNKPTKFLTIHTGYQKYCSCKCASLSTDTKDKRKTTNLERFGYEHAVQNTDIKQKCINNYIKNNGALGNASQSVKQKQEITMIDLYGVKHALQNPNIKDKYIQTNNIKYNGIGAGSDIIKDKIIQTNIKKYNNDFYIQTDDFKKKSIQTNLIRYGHNWAIQNKDILNKSIQSKKLNFIKSHEDIIDVFESEDILYYIVKCPHTNCSKCINRTYNIPASIYWDRKRDHTEMCTNLLPVHIGNNKDTSLELFVQNILDEYNITYIKGDRQILDGKELDIYIPDKNIAIECNGCYWHSTRNKDTKYHINKYINCLNHNIQLIQIWQDWIIYKPEIVKSIILSKLGIYKKRIGARKCIIKEISSNICNRFLNENHIQGSGKSTIKLGLYYNNELVSVMTFGGKIACSGNKDKSEWNLNRFCTLKNTQVIGGANKLFKYFIKKYNPNKIVSFSSNDISNGKLYINLGFFKEGTINNCYWYIDKKTYKRYHRSNFTLSSLKEKGWDIIKNETETMYNHGYLQCYDSGQQKWVYQR